MNSLEKRTASDHKYSMISDTSALVQHVFVLSFVISSTSQLFDIFWIKYEVLLDKKKQNLNTDRSMCSDLKVRTSSALCCTTKSVLLWFHQELRLSVHQFPPDLALIVALTTSHAPERSSAQSRGASKYQSIHEDNFWSVTYISGAAGTESQERSCSGREKKQAQALALLMSSHTSSSWADRRVGVWGGQGEEVCEIHLP